MLLGSWSVGDVSAVVISITTIVYTAGTFFLWQSSRSTVRLLEKQIGKQNVIATSDAHHKVIDAHRELVQFLLLNPQLTKYLAQDVDLPDYEKIAEKFVGILFMNHCLRIFVDYESGILDKREFQSFTLDVALSFKLTPIGRNWDEVKRYHPEKFVKFIDNEVMPILNKLPSDII